MCVVCVCMGGGGGDIFSPLSLLSAASAWVDLPEVLILNVTIRGSVN